MGNSDQKSPAELRAERFEALRSEWNDLSGRVTLGHMHDQIEDAAAKIEALPHQIEEFRSRGYRFDSGWEARATTLNQNWPERRREAARILREQSSELRGPAKEIETLCDRPRLVDSGLDRLEHKLSRLESQISTAENSVRGAFDSLNNQVYELQREFSAIEFVLDSLDSASFEIFPAESIVAACKAIWLNHPDEPEGILFLSDGRVIYEQREKKAKKKMLFITTESELVQKKLWEAPVGTIADAEAEDKKRFLKRKELLHLHFTKYDSGLHGDVTLRLEGTTNEEWVALIKRVQSGEIEAEQVAAPEAEAAAEAESATPAKEIPTKCPACGGQLPSIFKGMQELTCEYCSTTIRL